MSGGGGGVVFGSAGLRASAREAGMPAAACQMFTFFLCGVIWRQLESCLEQY